MLEIDNQRLYAENDRLRQTDRSDHHHPDEASLREKTSQLETLVNSLQCSNVIIFRSIRWYDRQSRLF